MHLKSILFIIFLSTMMSLVAMAQPTGPATAAKPTTAAPVQAAAPVTTPAAPNFAPPQPPSPPAPPPARIAMNTKTIFANTKPSVFKLETRVTGANTGREHGTAFVINTNGYLITNYHVVADYLAQNKRYELILLTGEGSFKAKVIRIDAVNDLALVKVEHTFTHALSLAANSHFDVGESIFSLGYPKTEEIEIIQGTYNGISSSGFAPALRASMPLNPGMSGGPTLNEYGEVIGVNRAMLLQAQDISYLSPLEPLQNLVAFAETDPKDEYTKEKWQKSVVDAIQAQEKTVMGAVAKIDSKKGFRQRLEKISFALPFDNAQCGQDKISQKDHTEFLQCQTVSLSLLDTHTEALQILTVASHDSGSFVGFMNGLGIDAKYYVAHAHSRQNDDDEAPEKPMSAKLFNLFKSDLKNERCNTRNVQNNNGIRMNVRYCTLANEKFKGIYSTFVKIELTDKPLKDHKIAQAYEGMTLTTTANLIETFIESIQSDGEP